RKPDRPEAGEKEREQDAEPRAERETAERLLERVEAVVPEGALVVPERLGDVGGLRQQERLDVEQRRQALPEPDAEKEDGDRRDPVAQPCPDLPREAGRDRLDDGRAQKESPTRDGTQRAAAWA